MRVDRILLAFALLVLVALILYHSRPAKPRRSYKRRRKYQRRGGSRKGIRRRRKGKRTRRNWI